MRKLSNVKFSKHIPSGITLELYRVLFQFDDGSVNIFQIVASSTPSDVSANLRKLANKIDRYTCSTTGRGRFNSEYSEVIEVPRKDKGLSQLQVSVLNKVKEAGKLRWVDTEAKETHSLTSLVKRGLLETHCLDFHGNHCRDSYWTLKQ